MADRRTLTDTDGTPIATFYDVTRGGRRVADLLALEVPVKRALAPILAQLKGYRVAGPVELGRALIEAGGRPVRHAHVYSHDLKTRPEPEPPPGITLTPVDRAADELVPAYLAAHPPDHPDYVVIADEDSAAWLRSLLAGPLLGASGLAIADGAVVGAILVHEVEPPLGGPWVMELFRDPGCRGVGRALLERALSRTTGSLGLVVTEGSPAARLYERLGFRRVLSTWSVDL
ncbi:MAG TPA: GNAT family N-acetyltransferase [Solirubrobacter sp.]|nr:GNAT family N-acetyltransferase [Solirubrobacter sp.]